MPQTANIQRLGDEIDLVELIQKLWIEKWLIIGVAVAITAIAAAYAFLTPPIYRAQAVVLPPSLSDIAGFSVARNILNVSNNQEDSGFKRSGITSNKPFTTTEIYSVFTRNLQSEQSKQQFYNEVYLPSLDEKGQAASSVSYQDFVRRIFTTTATKAQPDRIVLSIEGRDPGQAAEWAERYIRDVGQQSLQEVLENAKSEVKAHRKALMRQIEVLRESAKARREDRLVQLKEALSVAQKIGLENPPIISGQMSDQLSAVMEGNLSYMRGTKALKAEIEALKTRVSDDPFIPQLRRLQEQASLYASFQIPSERLSVYLLDGTVQVPHEPINPKKLFVVALGLIVGILAGIFVAMAQMVSNNSRFIK